MRYELKKLLNAPFIIVCISAVMFFFIFFSYRAFSDRSSYDKEISEKSLEFIEAYGDRLSDEEFLEEIEQKISEAEEVINCDWEKAVNTKGELGNTLYDDYCIYEKVYSAAEYIYETFPADRIQIVTDSLGNISQEKTEEVPDEQTIAENEKVIELYNNVLEMPLTISGDMFFSLYYFDLTLWDYAFIALIVMLTVRMFTIDITSGSCKMIYTSKNGNKRLFIKQYTAVALTITAVLAAASATQIAAAYSVFGIKDFTLPIQTYEMFEFSPYPITVWQFFLLKFIAKILVCLIIAALTALISIASGKPLISCVLSFILAAVPYMLSTYFFLASDKAASDDVLQKVYSVFRCLVPQSFLIFKTYFTDFDYVMIGTFAVSRLSVCFASSVFILIVILLFARSRFAESAKRLKEDGA